MDVPNFGRVVAIAAALIIANGRQHWPVMGTRQERPCRRDFWEVIVQSSFHTVVPKLQNYPLNF